MFDPLCQPYHHAKACQYCCVSSIPPFLHPLPLQTAVLTFMDSCEWSGGCGGCSTPVRLPGLVYSFDANRVVDVESALPPSVCLEANVQGISVLL